MAYLAWDTGALLSASPELLLEVEGRAARTRPIKGTIRRATDPEEDARLRGELLESVKDNAELAMIVDLERNDLGRVAVAGSVRVEDFPSLRSYAGLH
ncbi:MAG TPA: aminodeoxychorismate synthase, component I, partial [Chromatiaceae bacterium]|nr:aminodeoxychorismate synthase, component I [Chromatiaceae bacterium]